MKSNLKCEVVQDLLSLYIEDLTSDVTNKEIELHLDECRECKCTESNMRKEIEVDNKEQIIKEVDYLKKVRKYNKKKIGIVIGVCVAFLLAFVCGLIVNVFVIGNEMPADQFVLKDVEVNGKVLTISGFMNDSYSGFTNIEIQEKNGVVNVKVYTAPISIFSTDTMYEQVEFDNKIQKVYIGDNIVYDSGTRIDVRTSSIYNAKVQYVGDVSGLNDLIYAMEDHGVYFNNSRELITDKEPYGINIIVDLNSEKDENTICKQMKKDSYILLACVGNLGVVNWKYTIEGEEKVYTVSKEEADEFIGGNVKECGKDIIRLQELIQKEVK